jgi:hypothetical protein
MEGVVLALAFFLGKRGVAKIVVDSCSSCVGTVYQGVEFCIRCGRALTVPKGHRLRRDIVVMLSISILLVTAGRFHIPVFTSYEAEPTVWGISLYGYEDEGLFNPPDSFSAMVVENSNSTSYLIEGHGVNATLKIFESEDSFTQELRNIQAGRKVVTREPVGSFPSARYLLLDRQGETTSVVYWSTQPYFMSPDGFVPIDLGIMVESTGNLTLARSFLEGIVEEVASRWSAAGWLSDNLWRSWQIYIRLSDYLPIIPAGVLFFTFARTARRKDGEMERRVEYASNMAPNDKLLLACITSAASKTGSASGLEVEAKWRQISSSEHYDELQIEQLEQFADLALVEKSLGEDGQEPVLRWKPRFPNS